MKCKQITKWQYTEKKRESQGYTIDSNGKKKYDYELVPYRHTNRRFIFPTHKKGLLFKKKCDGSNVKRVFEHYDDLRTDLKRLAQLRNAIKHNRGKSVEKILSEINKKRLEVIYHDIMTTIVDDELK